MWNNYVATTLFTQLLKGPLTHDSEHLVTVHVDGGVTLRPRMIRFRIQPDDGQAGLVCRSSLVLYWSACFQIGSLPPLRTEDDSNSMTRRRLAC